MTFADDPADKRRLMVPYRDESRLNQPARHRRGVAAVKRLTRRMVAARGHMAENTPITGSLWRYDVGNGWP